MKLNKENRFLESFFGVDIRTRGRKTGYVGVYRYECQKQIDSGVDRCRSRVDSETDRGDAAAGLSGVLTSGPPFVSEAVSITPSADARYADRRLRTRTV